MYDSHLVTIPPGPHILSDMLISTPIIAGEQGGAGGFGGSSGGGNDYEFGVDPNLDPELALALRISMEEEKARQEAEAAKSGGGEKQEQQGESSAASTAPDAAPQEPKNEDHEMYEDDAELQAALAMSMGENADHDGDVNMEDLDEQAQLARALEMSMDNDNTDEVNEEMMSAVLGSLPGVDASDERIKKAMDELREKKGKGPKKDEDKK